MAVLEHWRVGGAEAGKSLGKGAVFGVPFHASGILG